MYLCERIALTMGEKTPAHWKSLFKIFKRTFGQHISFLKHYGFDLRLVSV